MMQEEDNRKKDWQVDGFHQRMCSELERGFWGWKGLAFV